MKCKEYLQHSKESFSFGDPTFRLNTLLVYCVHVFILSVIYTCVCPRPKFEHEHNQYYFD